MDSKAHVTIEEENKEGKLLGYVIMMMENNWATALSGRCHGKRMGVEWGWS